MSSVSRRAGLRTRGRRPYVIYLLHGKVMAGLHCVCGDSFMASCDIDPESCAVAWLLLIPSAMVHAARCCAWGGDDEDTDSDGDGEPCTMYKLRLHYIYTSQDDNVHVRSCSRVSSRTRPLYAAGWGNRSGSSSNWVSYGARSCDFTAHLCTGIIHSKL